MASARAVPGLVTSRPRATSAAWWSVVGATSTFGLASTVTIPTENVAGRPSMNVLACASAAASRLGETSVAFMESDVSMASMTVACWRAAVAGTVGWAAATVASTSPAANTTATAWRHHGAFPGTSSGRRAGAANLAASRRRRNCISR